MMMLETNAKRQWADWRDDSDEMQGRYYVNVYYDFGEGFIRRNTVKDDLSQRAAVALCNKINAVCKAMGQAK